MFTRGFCKFSTKFHVPELHERIARVSIVSTEISDPSGARRRSFSNDTGPKSYIGTPINSVSNTNCVHDRVQVKSNVWCDPTVTEHISDDIRRPFLLFERSIEVVVGRVFETLPPKTVRQTKTAIGYPPRVHGVSRYDVSDTVRVYKYGR